MSDSLHRARLIPLLCGICLFVQLITSPNFRLPLPLGTEDLFISDWLLRAFPLQSVALQAKEIWRIFSYVLLHGSWWHLGFNLLGLWITGITLERLLGWRKMTLLLLCGAAAGALGFLASLLLDPRLSPQLTCIGASALLTTCLGVATTLAPKETLTLWLIVFPLRIKALYLAPLLFLIFCAEASFPNLGTAYGAHLGGWLIGMLIGFFLHPSSSSPKGNTP